MGVIGIVSALTLPNLNSSTGEKELVAKVKKIYQNLNDSFGRAVGVYGPYDEWFVNDSSDDAKTQRVAERMIEFLKTQKECKFTTDGACFINQKAKNLSDNSSSLYNINAASYYKIITSDGSSLAWRISAGGTTVMI